MEEAYSGPGFASNEDVMSQKAEQERNIGLRNGRSN